MSDELLKLKHIKLDKFIYGENQHIFKTNIHTYQLSGDTNNILSSLDIVISTKLDSLNNNIKYNEFATIMYDSKTSDNYNYELLDFEEIQCLYKNNYKEFNDIAKYLTNISDYYKEYFNYYLIPKENKERIDYYNNIKKPIDIININNTGFLLSNLQNVKHTELIQQNQLLEHKNFNINATNKYKYKDAWNYLIDRPVSYPESNNIPLYDLSFDFFDTIKFNSQEDIIQLLNNDDLNKLSTSFTYINQDDNYISINLLNFIETVINNKTINYKISSTQLKQLIIKLISKIQSQYSLNKYIDKINIISMLNTYLKPYILNNSIISSIFNISQSDISKIFEKTYLYNYSVEEIPQNTLYIENLENNKILSNQIYDKTSTYINFINLKNNQNPEYNYDLSIPDKIIKNRYISTEDFYITLTQNNNIYFNGQAITLDLINYNYNIEYISGKFYKFYYTNNIYKNDLILRTISSNTEFKTISSFNKYETESSILSSHISQAYYEFKNIKITNIIGNKAVGIDFNVPPEYKYNIYSDFSKNNSRYYIEKNQTGYPLKQYFLSGITFCYGSDSFLSSSENLFAENDFKPYYENEDEKTENINVKIQFTEKSQYNKLIFYFNSPDIIYGSCTFKISLSLNNYEMHNPDVYKLFDIDKNKSLQFNKNVTKDNFYNYTSLNNKTYMNPTKYNVSSIINKCIIADNQLAKNNKSYKQKYPDRMETKADNYIKQYDNFHIENNNMAEIGSLNGIRIYEHVGNNLNNIWLSYKYITTQSENILNALTISIKSIFNTYNINRFSQHMQINDFGTIQYKGIDNIKSMNTNKYLSPYVFNSKNCNYLCSSCFHCKLLNNEKNCQTGYCTFPYNNKSTYIKNNYVYPNGCYWSVSGYNNIIDSYSTNFISDNIFKITLNNNYQTELFSNTNIVLNDDIEVYFISNKIQNSDIVKLFDNLDFKEYTYFSIFQGYGNSLLNENFEQIYPDYLMINNKNNTYESTYDYIEFKNQFNKIYDYLSDQNKFSTEKLSSIFTLPLYNYIYNFIHLDETKQQCFILNDKIIDLANTKYAELLSTSINELLASSDYYFVTDLQCNSVNEFSNNVVIPNHIQFTYQQIATTNLYDMLKTNTVYKNEILSFPDKKTLIDTYILNNGFVIQKNSPFNGPHTINAKTKFTGLLLSGNNINEILSNTKESILLSMQTNDFSNIIKTTIPKNYNILLRVVNWWDNTPKCIGTFETKPILNSIKDNTLLSLVNNMVNQYDFVECMTDESLFKYNQDSYKKSNIYSIKVKNSGLNPDNSILSNCKQAIILKDYINLSDSYKKLYTLIDWNTINTDIQNNNQTNIIIYESDLKYISNNCQYEFIKANKFNSIQDIKTENSNLRKFYINTNGYYQLNTNLVNEIITIKNDLKNNFQNAIKTSVSRYMPVDTKLWKIIYEDK